VSLTNRATRIWRLARFLTTRARLKVLARFAPKRHDELLLRLWLTPMTRGAPSGPVSRWHWQGEDRVAVYEEGQGPTVLLVHGWDGSANDMKAFASAFARAGYRALRIDLPAHGASTGEWTTLPHWARTIRQVVDQFAPGHVAGIVSHSLGGAATLLSVRDGATADAVVLLAPPREAPFFFSQFAAAFGASDDRRDGALRELEAMVGPLDEFDCRLIASHLSTPGLVMHDRGDRQVPYEHGRGIAEAWPGAELVPLEGLGHRRLLTDATVIERVVRFVEAQRYSSVTGARQA
jgi:pimeloyl-ACP methyl ester carboxylesterase